MDIAKINVVFDQLITDLRGIKDEEELFNENIEFSVATKITLSSLNGSMSSYLHKLIEGNQLMRALVIKELLIETNKLLEELLNCMKASNALTLSPHEYLEEIIDINKKSLVLVEFFSKIIEGDN